MIWITISVDASNNQETFRAKEQHPVDFTFLVIRRQNQKQSNSFSWLNVFRFASAGKELIVTKFSDLQSILHLVATTFVNRIHTQNHGYTKGYAASVHQPRQASQNTVKSYSTLTWLRRYFQVFQLWAPIIVMGYRCLYFRVCLLFWQFCWPYQLELYYQLQVTQYPPAFNTLNFHPWAFPSCWS